MKCHAYVQGTKHTYNYNNNVRKNAFDVNSGTIASDEH